MPRRSNSPEPSGNRRGSSRSSKPTGRGKSDDKPYTGRSGSSKKPFKKFDSEGGKSFRKKEDQKSSGERPYSNRSGASKRPYKKFDSGEERPFRKRDDQRSADERPGRSEGKRPFNKFDSRSEKPYSNRSDASKKPFRKFDSNEDKPFRKKATSKFSDERPDRTEGKRPFRKVDDAKSPKPFRKKSEGFDDTKPGRTRDFRKSDSTDSDKPFRRKRDEGFSEHKPKKFSNEKSFDKPRRKQGDKQPFKSGRHDQFEAPAQTEKVRLNKYIANSGVCSRREADELITMGLVSVNGKVITELGYKVNPGDEVRHDGKLLRAERPVYILMNKPKGYLTTTSDPQERNTVMHIIADAVKERIYPVGRLDRNTTGLLLLTNDGDLADKLMHPSYNAKKIYKVELDRPISRADFEKVKEGVRLEEGRAMVDDLAIISDDGKTVGVEIHIGWNRVVRRIFESLDYTVVKLDRSVYAGLDKKDLPRGHWRFLTREEVVMLKHYK